MNLEPIGIVRAPVGAQVDGAVTPPWVEEIMKDYF